MTTTGRKQKPTDSETIEPARHAPNSASVNKIAAGINSMVVNTFGIILISVIEDLGHV